MKKRNHSYSRFSNLFKSLNLALTFALATLIFPIGISAQTQLDTTFNAGVTEAMASVFVSTTLSDGKVLVGGQFNVVNGVERGFLARLNPDGTFDNTFNSGGFGPNSSVYEIIELAGGKILIGGSFTQYNGATIRGLVRLNADGSLDASFNPGGSGVSGSVQGITLQADGKILISGSNIVSYNGVINKFSAVRVNSDGTLDSTFNSPFIATDFVEEVDVQADGKILVAGDFIVGTPARTDIVRLNADGSIDSTFNSTGGGTDLGIYAMSLQTDGKILIGGNFTTYNFISQIAVARLNTDGSLDSSFASPAPSGSSTEFFALQPDGKILVAGNFTLGFNNAFPLIRLNADGSFDNSFQINPADNTGYHVKLQPNGQIILTGYFNTFDVQPRNGIVRLNAGGGIDNTFNAAFFSFGTVNAVAQQSDGKLMVGGVFRRANGSLNVNIARFNLDGTLDTNFNTGSGTNPGSIDFFTSISAIAVQRDGKILVGGRFSRFNETISSGIIRLNADGSVDTSFTNNLDPNNPNIINDILVLPDNKILTGGAVLITNSGLFRRLLRLNMDGSIDTSFNSGGTGANSTVSKIIRQPNGKILIGGAFTTYNGTPRSRIARLNVDGTLDTALIPARVLTRRFSTLLCKATGKFLPAVHLPLLTPSLEIVSRV